MNFILEVLAKNLIPCAGCGKIGQGIICNNCQKNFIFYFENSYIQDQLEQTKNNNNSNKTYTKADTFLSINTQSISLFKYNKTSKNLLLNIKKRNFHGYRVVLRNFLNLYFHIDPFNLFNFYKLELIKICKQTKQIFNNNVLVLIIPMPSTRKSLNQRLIHVPKFIAKQIQKVVKTQLQLFPWCRVEVIELLAHKGKKAQKELSLWERINNAYTNMYIKKDVLSTIMQQNTYIPLIVLIDDVITSGATMQSATNLVSKALKIKNKQKLFKYPKSNLNLYKTPLLKIIKFAYFKKT